MNCEFCSSPVHVWFQCPKKPDGWKPARLAKESTAARKDVQGLASLDTSSRIASEAANNEAGNLTGLGNGWETKSRNSGAAGTQALPVDTNPPQPLLLVVTAPDRRAVDKDDQTNVEKGRDFAAPLGLASPANASDAKTANIKDAPKFDKVAYQARYMREVYRPRLKAKKEAMK